MSSIPESLHPDDRSILPAEPEKQRELSKQEVEDAAKSLGCETLTPKTVKSLETLGLYADQVGAIKLAKGKVMVSLDAMHTTIAKLKELLEHGDQYVAINAASAINQCSKTMLSGVYAQVKLEELEKDHKTGPQGPVPSFGPGSNVQINHYSNQPKEENG